MDDDAMRLGLLCTLVAAGVLLAVGGACTPLQGHWLDGTRQVTLRRWGCFVRGEATFDGGHQRFAGMACFGRLLLWRRDYGERHLLALGFPSRQVPTLQGRVTGAFWLRVNDGGRALHGAFYGRHFTFPGDGSTTGRFVPAAPRHWTRASD